MSTHRHRAAGSEPTPRFGRSLRASAGLGLVGLLAGLLFSTSASLAADSPERRPENLRDLVRLESERLAETNAEVVALREEVAGLLEQRTGETPVDERLAFAAGATAVTGPGPVVRLWDAPTPVQLPRSEEHTSALQSRENL